jgi:serine protease Do
MRFWSSSVSGNTTFAVIAAVGLAGARVDAQTPTPPERTFVVQPPSGWFGVRLEDQATIDERGNAFFDSYPVVSEVDSKSPAAKAGVKPGDVIISFSGHDMRGGSLQMNKWLRVGAPFVLQVRRNGQKRVLHGVLGKRPQNWEQQMYVELSVPDAIERRGNSISQIDAKTPTPLPMREMIRPRMPAPEPLPSVLTRALGYGGGVYPFAGAEFTALNDDLCEVLGLKGDGVFVTRVVENSPARNAGLRGGDVILRADSIRVGNPMDLVRAIKNADEGDRTLTLRIIRKHSPGSVVLRW